ncbi:AAA family ATPase [Yasminevirus sp. GU-2018]|uniref:AAA family ATPase n=1 Tax=Yasminevirus sp. GU-2018 TaxID=2420051 RepID=A0A5K0U9M5_9VIRU|nr:AAA family ATPase [Yasminevirus sp. GU-2018]
MFFDDQSNNNENMCIDAHNGETLHDTGINPMETQPTSTLHMKRSRWDEPPQTHRNKRFKSSYFGEPGSVVTDPTSGRVHKRFDPPSEENKIIFLVSDKSSYDVTDESFDDLIFNDDEIDDLLNFLNEVNKKPSNDEPKSITTKDPKKRPYTPSQPPNRTPTNPPNKTPTNPPTVLPNKPPLVLPPPTNPGPLVFPIIFPTFPRITLSSDDEDSDDVLQPPTKKPKTTLPTLPAPKPVVVLECKNPLCNHKTEEEDPTPLPDLNVQSINNIDDLITLGKAFHCKRRPVYNNLNLRLMNNLVVPLVELKDMIGMTDVKTHIVSQILFFLQGFNSVEKCNKCQDCVHGLPCIQKSSEMMHTVITGPPGVGKTCLGRIMGKVYKAMGILSNGDFHEVTRTDFLAGYLGQTAAKTQKLIDKCKGGVMFIDEAYSLGSKENRDSFSKEALDTLNKNLSDNRDMLCIIAGYEKDLDKCFFAVNDGLKRRFTFRYNVSEYDYKELLDIFKLKVKNENWTIDFNSEEAEGVVKYTDSDLLGLFRANKDCFPYSGGDIETYFLQCKIAHGRRLPQKRKCLSFNDLKSGLAEFVKNRKTKKVKKDDDEEDRPNMYVFK